MSVYTNGGYTVDLGRLEQVIGFVSSQRDHVRTLLGEIDTEFTAVKDSWNTPSSATFDEVHTWFMKVTSDVESVLDDMIVRLNQAYENYKAAEEANTRNLSHGHD